MPKERLWQVSFDKRAEKMFAKLDKTTQKRIKDFIDQKLIIEPIKYLIMLAGSNKFSRARVGDYRIIMEIKDQELLIIIIDVGHRRERFTDDF